MKNGSVIKVAVHIGEKVFHGHRRLLVKQLNSDVTQVGFQKDMWIIRPGRDRGHSQQRGQENVAPNPMEGSHWYEPHSDLRRRRPMACSISARITPPNKIPAPNIHS